TRRSSDLRSTSTRGPCWRRPSRACAAPPDQDFLPWVLAGAFAAGLVGVLADALAGVLVAVAFFTVLFFVAAAVLPFAEPRLPLAATAVALRSVRQTLWPFLFLLHTVLAAGSAGGLGSLASSAANCAGSGAFSPGTSRVMPGPILVRVLMPFSCLR